MSDKKEYIERGALIEKLKEKITTNYLNLYDEDTLESIIRFAEKQPAADVEPVVRGRWKGEGMGDYRCSWCDEVVSGKPNYCRNCGAHMMERSGSGE